MSVQPGIEIKPEEKEFYPKEMVFFVPDEEEQKIMELVGKLSKEDQLKFNKQNLPTTVQLAGNSHMCKGCTCIQDGLPGHKLTWEDFGFEEGWKHAYNKL